jgi:hypothetical protein
MLDDINWVWVFVAFIIGFVNEEIVSLLSNLVFPARKK